MNYTRMQYVWCYRACRMMVRDSDELMKQAECAGILGILMGAYSRGISDAAFRSFWDRRKPIKASNIIIARARKSLTGRIAA